MKKSFSFLSKSYLLSFTVWVLILVSFTAAISVDNLTTAIDDASIKQGSIANQTSFLKNLQTLLTSPNFTNSNYAQIFSELNQYITNKIKTLQTSPSPTTQSLKKSDETNYITLPNIDSQSIRDTVLQRHNQERISKGLTPYSYHSDLEKSAQTRADQLNTEARTSNTHTRNPEDGYYNYDSITNRFNNLWITFSAVGWGKIAFSESVGRGYYNCTSNCTQELIKQLQTTRDFFMSEKSTNGSHYRAITMNHFIQMGIGVSIDTARKRYYLVVHYGTDILE